MVYRVNLTGRPERDLRRLYFDISASSAARAQSWFKDLERVILSLDAFPARGAPTPENQALRQILHGRKPHVYRVIYSIDEKREFVSVLQVRHGRRDAFE